MIGKNNILWLFVFSLFIMAGCEHDPQDEPVPDRMVTINFTVGSLLKAAATPEEKLITEDIILFGVNGSGSEVTRFVLSPSGGQLSLPGTITMLYAIANPTPALAAAATPANLGTLQSLTGDFSTAPVSPFLMSGKAPVSTGNVTIPLIRCVAKIKLNTNSNFLIKSVTVSTASTGYVFDPSPWSVPALTRVNYTYTVNSPVIYIAEHRYDGPAKFTVTGRFLDMPAHLEWTKEITLKNGDGTQNIDIKRNTCYEVDVNFVKE